jgi:hypothetical protein
MPEIVKKKLAKEKMPEARPMYWEEMEAMSAEGFDPADHVGDSQRATRAGAGMFKWIIKNVYGDYDFTGVPYPECLILANTTYELTYGTEDGIKNS